MYEEDVLGQTTFQELILCTKKEKILGGWEFRASCRPHSSDQPALGKYSRDNPSPWGSGESI